MNVVNLKKFCEKKYLIIQLIADMILWYTETVQCVLFLLVLGVFGQEGSISDQQDELIEGRFLKEKLCELGLMDVSINLVLFYIYIHIFT